MHYQRPQAALLSARLRELRQVGKSTLVQVGGDDVPVEEFLSPPRAHWIEA